MHTLFFNSLHLVCLIALVFTGTSRLVAQTEKSVPKPPLKIAILLYDKVTALDAIGPFEVLTKIDNAAVMFVGKNKGLIKSDNGILTLQIDCTFSEVPSPDIIVVPGGVAGTFAAAKDSATLQWLRKADETSTYTTSVCTGAIILGEAGLLKNVNATTHWAAKDFLRSYGATYLNERYVHQGKRITAAGVSAGIDMALYLVGLLKGNDYAAAVQLALQYDPKPPLNAGSETTAPPSVKQMMQAMYEKILTPYKQSSK
jgi:transcriptional regulator GlxA family with amidase domain